MAVSAIKTIWDRIGFWLSVILAALSVVSLLKHGLAVKLHGLPEIIAKWYKLVFHGAFDLIFFWLPFSVPLFLKDIFAVYVICGFSFLRALSVQKSISFIDELGNMDFEKDMLERVFRYLFGKSWLGRKIGLKGKECVARLVCFLFWPALIPFLYWEWTKTSRENMAFSEQLFHSIDRYPTSNNAFAESVRQLERAADTDSAMYIGIVERDGFILSLSLSLNFVFLSVVAFFIWSEISITP